MLRWQKFFNILTGHEGEVADRQHLTGRPPHFVSKKVRLVIGDARFVHQFQHGNLKCTFSALLPGRHAKKKPLL
jgi:hypothetical protein